MKAIVSRSVFSARISAILISQQPVKKVALAFLLAIAANAFQMQAAILTWTNTTGGTWSTSANWSPNQVPGPLDTAILSNGVNTTNSSALTVSNVTFTSGNLKGAGPLTVLGKMNWTGGDLSGPLVIASGATLNVSNSVSMGASTPGGALTNNGTVVWTSTSGVPFYGYGGCVIYNAGLWQALADGTFQNQSGLNVFINSGTFQKTGGSGSTSLNWTFNTTGTLATPSGSFSILTWTGLNTLNGTANLTFNSLNAPLLVSSNAVMNWVGGDISAGSLTIAAGGTLTISNSVNFSASAPGGALTNYGTVIWAAGSGAPIYGYGSSIIYNSGLWQALADSTFQNQVGSNAFVNTGTFQKTGGSAATAVNWSFTTTGTLDTPSGSLSLANWSGSSTLHGSPNISGGTVFGGLTVPSGQVLNGSSLSIRGSLSVLSNGVMNWGSGDISTGFLNVSEGGALTISNSVSFGSSGPGSLTNFGTVIWGATPGLPIYGYGGAVIYNAGLWQAVTDNSLVPQAGTNLFLNTGTLQKIGAAGGTTTIGWFFTTTGTLDTPVGSFSIGQWGGASTLHGTANVQFTKLNTALTIASNAVMNWLAGDISAGALTVASGATLTISNSVSFGSYGMGGVLTNYGKVIWAGNLASYGYGDSVIYNAGLWQAVANNNLNNQQGTNTFINAGSLQKIGGINPSVIAWNFNTTGTVDTPASNLSLSKWTGTSILHGTANLDLGTMNGSLTIASNAVLNWLSGDIGTGALTIAAGGIVTISNSITFGYNGSLANGGGVLTNYGTVIWAGNVASYGYGGSVIHNAGLLQAVANNNLNVAQGSNTFINTGTLQKIGGVNPTTIGWRFNTTGTVETPAGILSLSQWTGASLLHGTATLDLGTMNASLTVASNAVLNWNTGDIGTGALAVAAGGTLAMSNSFTLGYNNSLANGGGTLTNFGKVIWAGDVASYGYGGTVIHNAGLLQAVANNSLNNAVGNNSFINTGTLQKIGGVNPSGINWAFTNTGTLDIRAGGISLGSIAVQTAGLTFLDGGHLTLTQPLQLLGGTLAGTNTITGTVTNSSVVSPGASPGLLTINGSYIQTASGVLAIELGGTNVGSEYDRLAVSGAAALAGTLAVTLIDPYLPSISNTFRVMSYGSFSGGFGTVNGLVISSNLLLQATYLAAALDLVTAQNTNHLVAAPSIVSQPQNQTIVNGQTASFLVTAAGTRPVTYQWQREQTNYPGATSSTLTFANAQTNQSGNYRVIVTNSAGSATSVVAVLTVIPIADLVITDITNPTNGNSGQPFSVSWRSLNQGSQSAAGPWSEGIALSTNSAGDFPTSIGSFTFQNTLSAGQSVVRTQSVIAPSGFDGVYYLVVSTDTGNQVYEADNENNNRTIGATPIRLRSPDLQPLALSSSPGSAQFGVTIPFSWVTTNSGSGSAQVSWTDRVYLATLSNSFSGVAPLTSVLITNIPLTSGSSISNFANLLIPLSSVSSNGTYYLLVSSDDGNTVAESRETNNLASRVINLSLPPLPDLAVTNILCPTQALAGVQFTLQWTVTNRGSADLISGAWTETVTVSNATAEITLTELRFTNTIHVGESITRTQQVTLPPYLPAGAYQVLVTADTFGEVIESNEANNTGLATNALTLPAQLMLAFDSASVNEGGPAFTGTITRNGSLAQSLTVTLTNSRPDKLTIPNQVIIPAGWNFASFTGTPLLNGIVDANVIVTVSAGAANYSSATSAVTVINIDLPSLALSFPSPTLPKGQTMLATVSRTGSVTQSLTVFLSSSSASHLTVPVSVVIPSNQVSVSFPAAALDNGLIEGTLTNQVTASATGFSSSTASIAVLDTDFPTVVLTLTSTSISEGAGPQATLATVTRSPVAAYPIVIDLVSSNPSKVLVPATAVIPGGLAAVSFPVSAVNNSIVDGDQTVQLRVFIRAANFNGDIAEGTGASVLVTDDDGPALALSLNSDAVAEGLSPALTATVTRNTTTNTSLLVNLTNSRPDKATAPVSVTIPIGAPSTTFNVTTLANAVADGNQTVLLSAGAAGFSSAAASFVISDLNLPDLTITQLSAVTNAQTDAYFSLNYTLKNQGFLASGSNLVTRFYLSTAPMARNDILLGDAVFSGSLAAGQSFAQSVQFRLPSTSGQYWVVAIADPDNKISELREDNNTRVTVLPIAVQTAYTATLQASLLTGIAPTNVTLSGFASLRSGGPAQFVPISIHIFLRGTERVIEAITDGTGHFSTSFTPLPNEAGSYLAGAAHPGEATPQVQVAFTLLGLKLSPPSAAPIVVAGSSITGAVDVVNFGDTPLTSLAGAVVGAPGNLSVALSLSTNRVEAQSTIELNYTITALDASQPQGLVQLRVTGGEGPVANGTLPVSVWPLHSQLAAMPGSLTAAMALGGQQQVQFRIVNQGGVATGPITLSLPVMPWLSLATPNPLPSLAPGASNLVTLLLTPATNLLVGPYSGSLVASASGSAVAVPFNFQAMTVARGSLQITAQDEFSFYGAGAPNVTNAQVTVSDPATLVVVTNGVTDANGRFFAAQLPEAYYNIELTAAQHTTYKGVVHVVGGVTNDLSAFLSRQVVQYSWSVVPTTIEDRTRITILTTFETFVPAPVITIDPALIDLADYGTNGGQVVLTVQNHGLVAANGFQLLPVAHPNWIIQPLITDLGDIPAGGTLSIPVTLQPINSQGSSASLRARRAATTSGTAPCAASLPGVWHLVCGGVVRNYGTSVGFLNAGNCGSGPGGGNTLGGGTGGVSSGGGSGSSNSGGSGFSWPSFPIPAALANLLASLIQPSSPSRQQPTSCNPCLNARNDAAFGCLVDLINPFPLLNCFKGAFECGQSIGQGLTLEGAGGCLGAVPACSEGAESLMKKVPLLGPALDLISCGCAICGACKDITGDTTDCGFCDFNPFGGSTHAAARRLALVTGSSSGGDIYAPLIAETVRLQNMVAPMIYYFGSNIWLRVTNGNMLENLMSQFSASIGTNTSGGSYITPAERAAVTAQPIPYPLTAADVNAFLDRWNRTMTNYSAGIFNSSQVPANGITNFMAFDQWTVLVQSASETVDAYKTQGITDPIAFWFSLREGIFARLSGSASGTCAQVKVQLDQDLVLTRNAFNATLELANQSSTAPLSNVKVLLNISDNNGLPANNLFSISSPSVAGLGAVDGTGALVIGGSGTASWTLVPKREAATNGPTVYGVGGVLQYVQEGRALTIPLFSAPITVSPDPALYVKYFHQRDIYSDDPFTPQIEPSIPFVLGVMVENRGKGSANDLRIISSQPRIVDNEKGLAIDFKIIGSVVAGQSQTPSLTADFGSLAPGGRGIGLWYLTSTLQGLFLDYQASLQHVDDLGITNLSLIDELTIHELIHLVQAPGSFEDGQSDFLVNDSPDLDNLPDRIYLSDGSTNPVFSVTQAAFDAPASAGHLTVQMTAQMTAGWTYLQVPDPGNGQFILTRVVRSDGVQIYFNTNVWTTDRTFVGGGHPPVRENILHLLDYGSTGSYLLYYQAPPTPDTIAPTSAVAALPANSYPQISLSWSGIDNSGGGGIAFFDIFASVDGAPFGPWLQRTTFNSSLYPGQLGHSYAFYSLATDAAGNRQSAPSQPDAQTAVTLTNSQPAILASTNIVIDEGQTLSLTLPASDPDPGQTLSFSLGGGAPPSLNLNPATGLITWLTTEATGPSTNSFSVIATDNGQPHLSATGLVTVVVREVNQAPVLAPISNYTITEGSLLLVTNVATDADIPANILTFTLGPGAPTGTSINATNGIFQWQPSNTQGPSTNTITVIVTDNGTPPLGATQQFSVVVLDTLSDFTLNIGSTNILAGETGAVPIILRASLPLTNLTCEINSVDSVLTNLSLSPVNAEITAATIIQAGTNTYSMNLKLDPAQQSASVRTIANLNFLSISNNHSAIVFVTPSQILGRQSGGQLVTNGMATMGRVLVISLEPVLDVTNTSPLQLTLYGKPGTAYSILSSSNLTQTSWVNWTNFTLTNRSITLPVSNFGVPATYYRSQKQ